MKFLLLFIIVFVSCSDMNTGKNDSLKKDLYDQMMSCESCSVEKQFITYSDKNNSVVNEYAYAVLQDGQLFYVTVENMHVVTIDRVIAYKHGPILRSNGKEPKKLKMHTDSEGNVTYDISEGF